MRIRFLFVLIFFLFLNFCPVYAFSFDKIIVFGDSLSDIGNVFLFTSAAHQAVPSIPIVPKEPPYFQGRFTNGPVWIETVAKFYNVSLKNYAYGGAWAESVFESKQLFPFSLEMQVNFYLVNSFHDYDKDKHLYVIWIGSNDYLQGRKDIEYAITNTMATLRKQIDLLIYYGARKFLLLNLPDLSFVPQVIEKGSEFAANISQLSNLHNKKLDEMLINVKKQYADVKFLFLDINSYFSDMLHYPERYHLKNVTEACYGGEISYRLLNQKELSAAKKLKINILENTSLRIAYINGKLAAQGEQPCNNPDEYLFWDQIHPTQIIHAFLANYTSQLLDNNNI